MNHSHTLTAASKKSVFFLAAAILLAFLLASLSHANLFAQSITIPNAACDVTAVPGKSDFACSVNITNTTLSSDPWRLEVTMGSVPIIVGDVNNDVGWVPSDGGVLVRNGLPANFDQTIDFTFDIPSDAHYLADNNPKICFILSNDPVAGLPVSETACVAFQLDPEATVAI